MIARIKVAWLLSMTMAALAFLLVSTARLAGQTRTCCVTTAFYQCKGPGCSSSISACVPAYSYGMTGNWYNSQMVNCCGQQLSNFSQSGGTCNFGAAADARLTVRVWVRNCQGRYALLTLPVPA